MLPERRTIRWRRSHTSTHVSAGEEKDQVTEESHIHASYMVGNNGPGLELCTGLHQEQLNWCPNDIIIRQVSIRLRFPSWRCGPTRAMSSSLTRFLDHTQRRITVGRNPLDEWSARRRDLYLTTHNTHNRQTSMPPVGFRTHDLSRRATADLRLRPRGYWDRLVNKTSQTLKNNSTSFTHTHTVRFRLQATFVAHLHLKLTKFSIRVT